MPALRHNYKAEALELASRLGVEIKATSRELTAEAPRNRHWRWSCVHEFVVNRNDTWTIADCWRELAIRMRDGVEACGDSIDCRSWNEE